MCSTQATSEACPRFPAQSSSTHCRHSAAFFLQPQAWHRSLRLADSLVEAKPSTSSFASMAFRLRTSRPAWQTGMHLPHRTSNGSRHCVGRRRRSTATLLWQGSFSYSRCDGLNQAGHCRPQRGRGVAPVSTYRVGLPWGRPSSLDPVDIYAVMGSANTVAFNRAGRVCRLTSPPPEDYGVDRSSGGLAIERNPDRAIRLNSASGASAPQTCSPGTRVRRTRSTGP